jgi:hypothetical protein
MSNPELMHVTDDELWDEIESRSYVLVASAISKSDFFHRQGENYRYRLFGKGPKVERMGLFGIMSSVEARLLGEQIDADLEEGAE